MTFLKNNEYVADFKTVKNLKALANNPKTNVKQLMAKIKKFLPKFYQDDNDPLISSMDDEYQRLTFNNVLILDGHHMLAYLLKHVINFQTLKHVTFTPSYDAVFKHNSLIDNLASKIIHKTTLYTLTGSGVSDVEDMELTQTVPNDFNGYILNGMVSKFESNLVDKVNNKINKGVFHVPHNTRYHQLMNFINKDCSLTKCSSCDFYKGHKYNYSEKDLNGKDLDELVDIAYHNGYNKASNRLFDYYMYMSKKDLSHVGLDMVIADAQIYAPNLKQQENTADEMISQHWNNFPITNATFYYEPNKSNQPQKCYLDDNGIIHCPINDNVLHLHGEIEFY